MAYVALVPHWLWRFSLGDVTFPFQKYIAIATVIGFAINSFSGVRLHRHVVLSCVCLVIFVGISFVSALQSIVPEKSWFFMDVIYKIVLMLCIAVRVLETVTLLRAANLVIVLGIGWNAYEINLDYFLRGYSNINQDGWAYQNANGYALVLILGVFLAFSSSLYAKSKISQLFLLLVSALDIHAIYIVEARGAMVGCILSGVLVVWFMEKSRKNLTLLGLLILGAAVMAGPAVLNEFNSSFSSELDHSAESRYYIWDAGVRITLDNPLLGVGPWAAEHIVPHYYRDPSGWKPERLHLHNLLLEVSTGMGVPAAILYLAFFAIPLFKLQAILASGQNRIVNAICLGLVSGIPGYWLGSMFNSGALVEVPYLCMALGLAVINVVVFLAANPEEEESGVQEETIGFRAELEEVTM